jgi:hypothetical protein
MHEDETVAYMDYAVTDGMGSETYHLTFYL